MYAERVRMLMGNSLYVIVGAHVFSVVVLVLGLREFHPHPWLLPWALVVLLVTALRTGCIIHWRRGGVPVERARAIAAQFTALSMLAGLAWSGGAIVFFDPEHLAADVLICLILIGMATGGMGPSGPHFPAYAAFATAALLPFSLHLFFYDSLLMRFVALCGVFYTCSCLGAGAYLSARIRESVELRYENRQLIDDLETKRREAEQANEAKGRFLAAASHDLRQPLNSLALAVDMLESVPDGEPRDTLVRSIRSSVDATNDLLTGLLDVSRLDAGVVRPESRVIALAPLFSQIAEMFGPVALDRHVTLRVRPTSAMVHSDPALLGSVLQNLVGNAVRYVPQGGAVLVAARRRGPDWRIEIRDNGPGIAADKQQLIFEDFTRCQPGDVGSGLGLGLGIVRRVTRLLGHSLRLHSRPGRGSVFAVEISAARSVAPAPADAPEPRTPAAPVTVLLLAPDPSMRASLRGMLEARGLFVTAPEHLDEARRMLKLGTVEPQLLLVDGHRHGEFDGIDAVRWLTGREAPDLPAALMTSDMSSHLRRRARAAGIELVQKPVTADRVLALVGRLLPASG